MKRLTIFVLTSMTLLTACEKDELPIAPYERGPLKDGVVSLGAGYNHQLFFSFEQNAVTGENHIEDWDLAFEGGDDGWKVVLNEARMMAAWPSDFDDVATASDTAGFGQGKRVEYGGVSYDEPAMSDWRQGSPVYLIDMGYGAQGLPLGFYWVQVRDVNEDEYSIVYRALTGGETKEWTVPKIPDVAFTGYSLIDEAVVDTPKDGEWDIRFTKYTFRFLEPPMDYFVTGVLMPPGSAVADASHLEFETISARDTAFVQWLFDADAIGYDWKHYDFNSSTYVVDATRAWIIRANSGFYYKLRFTDYYDRQGNSGTPHFEFGKI